MPKVRILLGDDHTLVRQGFRKILEVRPDWEVVGEVDNGRDAVREAASLKPDVVVLDIGMPLLNGIDSTAQIVRRFPNTQILILSMHADEAYVTQALKAGARGYLLKDSADTELIRAISAVAAGKSFFSPAVAKVMLDDYVRHLAEKGIVDRFESLSEREREVFQISSGRAQQQGDCGLAVGESGYDRNAPRAYPPKVGCAQYSRTCAVRRSAGGDLMMNLRSDSVGTCLLNRLIPSIHQLVWCQQPRKMRPLSVRQHFGRDCECVSANLALLGSDAGELLCGP